MYESSGVRVKSASPHSVTNARGETEINCSLEREEIRVFSFARHNLNASHNIFDCPIYQHQR